MAKQPLTVVRSTVSLDEIAKALRISPKDALEKFTDPRVVSWFAEIWGETLFGFRRHPSSNHPGSDASLILGAIGRFDVSVRCFNKGNVKFQKSKFIGSGRKGTDNDLIESVEAVERIVIVDLRKFPTLDFYPIDSKSVLKRIREGNLTLNGLTPKRFGAWMNEAFETHIVEIEIPIPAPAGQAPENGA
jgi:hypothetical protein